MSWPVAMVKVVGIEPIQSVPLDSMDKIVSYSSPLKVLTWPLSIEMRTPPAIANSKMATEIAAIRAREIPSTRISLTFSMSAEISTRAVAIR